MTEKIRKRNHTLAASIIEKPQYVSNGQQALESFKLNKAKAYSSFSMEEPTIEKHPSFIK